MRKPTSVARYSIPLESSRANTRPRSPQTGGRLYGTAYHDARSRDSGVGRRRPFQLPLLRGCGRGGRRGGPGGDHSRSAAPAVCRRRLDADRPRDRQSFAVDQSFSRGLPARSAGGQCLKSLLFTDTPPTGKRAIWLLPVSGGGAPQPVVMTSYNAIGGRLSPDGRWLAFDSDETGQREVYIQHFPGPGTRVRVSSSGGMNPVWSRSGRELFYWERARLMAVELRLGAEIAFGTHKSLFEANLQPGGVLAQYDPHPDGQRFVVAAVPGSSSRLAVISNVLAGLEREVGAS